MSDLLPKLRAEQDRILAQSRSLLYFLDTAENGRQRRAKDLLDKGKVLSVSMVRNLISGAVRASTPKGSYAVSLRLRSRRGVWGVEADCSCYDSRSSSCKHALAVAGTQLQVFQKRWSTLEDASKVFCEMSAA